MTSLLTESSGNKIADDDYLFVCCACGKTSTTRYGFDDKGKSTASPGWDESCVLNAREYATSRLHWNAARSRVVKVSP